MSVNAGTTAVVATRSGKVSGTVENGLHVFRGISYGRTGGADGRWAAPRPPSPWTGIRPAVEFGPSSPQIRRGKPGRPPSVGAEPYDAPQSEECLTLNIWSPAIGEAGKRPVMIWLHGGGFSSGSARSPVFSGQGLAAGSDVVFVSLNHRLGPLGFLYFEDAEPNVGLLDLVAALQWVRDNIAAFGGDPDRVMIFGESGGGQKVCALLAMPMAKGLFHAAAVQSGAAIRMATIETAVELRERIAASLGIAPDPAEMRQVGTETLIQAASAAARQMPSRAPGFPGALQPVVDGHILPRHPFAGSPPECSRHIPLIIGYNKTEATYFHLLGLGPNDAAMSEAEMQRRLDPILGPMAGEIYAAFRTACPDRTPWQSYVKILTEFPSGIFAREIGRIRDRPGNAPTFLYRFDWETRVLNETTQSPHMIEIPFVLNNVGAAERMVGPDAGTFALARKVSSAWAALARNGVPDAELGQWPEYRTNRPIELHIDLTSRKSAPLPDSLNDLLRLAAGI